VKVLDRCRPSSILPFGGDGHAEFAHIGNICRLVDILAAGPGDIDPLGFTFAVGVERQVSAAPGSQSDTGAERLS